MFRFNDAASRYPTSQPGEGETLGQLDSLHSEPTEQEIEESLVIEQQILGMSEAAVYRLNMSDTPRPASALVLTTQLVTWEQVQGGHPAAGAPQSPPAGGTRGQGAVAAQTEVILFCQSSPLYPGTRHPLQGEGRGSPQSRA